MRSIYRRVLIFCAVSGILVIIARLAIGVYLGASVEVQIYRLFISNIPTFQVPLSSRNSNTTQFQARVIDNRDYSLIFSLHYSTPEERSAVDRFLGSFVSDGGTPGTPTTFTVVIKDAAGGIVHQRTTTVSRVQTVRGSSRGRYIGRFSLSRGHYDITIKLETTAEIPPLYATYELNSPAK